MTARDHLSGPASLDSLDQRIHAFDLNRRLVEPGVPLDILTHPESWTVVKPRPILAGARRVSLRGAPEGTARQVSEALPGEAMECLWDGPPGWSFVRTLHDRYLGWARTEHLQTGEVGELVVHALRGHAFASPSVKSEIVAELCRGSHLRPREETAFTEEHRNWLPVALPDGAPAWVSAAIFAQPTDTSPTTFAQRFLEVPYVWGGRSAWGLDCSGLTQLVYAAFGRALPRDADQQQAALSACADARAGDLVFFPGHVGLMLNDHEMIHANATHMKVTIETLGTGEYGRRLQYTCTGFGRWVG